MRLLTFNIRNGDADDGPNSWPYRQNICAEAIRRADADVVGLQEAFDYQLSYLLSELPEYEAYGAGRDDGKTNGEFAPILWRKDLCELLDGGTFWFSDTPDTPGSVSWGNHIPRICTWVRLGCGGREMGVFNVHLDHESHESRRRSAQMLAERANGGGPQVILGDFNAAEHWAPISLLRACGFRDSYRDVHPDARNVGTYHAYREHPYPEKIDYIFVNGAAGVVSAEITLERIYGRWPSDHALVTAEVRLD